LAGRRATTHWRYCDQFADRFHDIQLERDRIWVQDGPMWSSAGISAGVDLTLALIEKDQGVSVALQVTRELVVFLKRPGGQSQFSTVLSGQISDAEGPLGPMSMLRRPEGATVNEVVSATGWRRHTVRGVFSGTLKKKLGLTLASAKAGRARSHRTE
jgi:transcriptional regulator GlxA family with amidase domain